MMTAEEYNRQFHSAQQIERQRRKDAGLYVVSYHATDSDHWETQRDFQAWFLRTFRGPSSEFPMWSSGSSSLNGLRTHEWLLAKPEHVFAAKLRWGVKG